MAWWYMQATMSNTIIRRGDFHSKNPFDHVHWYNVSSIQSYTDVLPIAKGLSNPYG